MTFLLFGFYKLKGSDFFEIQINNFNHSFSKITKIKLIDYSIIIFFSIILFSPILYILLNFISTVAFENYLMKIYFLGALKNSFILSITTGILVTSIGFIISFLLVNFRKHIWFQQLLFIASSMILIISPIIISLGYFIILGELRYIPLITYVVVITINCIFLLPFSILIIFIKLKNIYLNYDEIKKSFNLNEINFIKIIYPLIKKNLIYIFSFSTAISFGDFTIISFFKNDSFQTLPTLLYRLITSYRFEEASFIAGFMLLFSLLIYLIFDSSFYKDSPDINI
jgi:thiamine transport system permease protein